MLDKVEPLFPPQQQLIPGSPPWTPQRARGETGRSTLLRAQNHQPTRSMVDLKPEEGVPPQSPEPLSKQKRRKRKRRFPCCGRPKAGMKVHRRRRKTESRVSARRNRNKSKKHKKTIKRKKK